MLSQTDEDLALGGLVVLGLTDSYCTCLFFFQVVAHTLSKWKLGSREEQLEGFDAGFPEF